MAIEDLEPVGTGRRGLATTTKLGLGMLGFAATGSSVVLRPDWMRALTLPGLSGQAIGAIAALALLSVGSLGIRWPGGRTTLASLAQRARPPRLAPRLGDVKLRVEQQPSLSMSRAPERAHGPLGAVGAIPEGDVDLRDDLSIPVASCRSAVRLNGQRTPVHGLTVAVVGLGYVGLPTALSMASDCSEVIGIDVSRARLDAIRVGQVDLLPVDRLRLDRALRSGHIQLTDATEAIGRADAVVICVPTPVDEHLVPDLACIKSACAAVVTNARPGQIIIFTSTSFVGTTRELLVKPLQARGLTAGVDVFVAFSPERIDPGNVDHAQRSVPRVLGGVTPECTAKALGILEKMTSSVHSVSSVEAAELTKLYENTFRAVNIAFANEMAEMSRVLELDIMEVIEAAKTKPYGFMAFYPGPGVGGHCIPCDPHYLLWQMRARRQQPRLVEQAMAAIAARPGQVVSRARELLAAEGNSVDGASVLVVGVAYKPGVEDVRGSPAIEIFESLRDAGAKVEYHDPLVPALRMADGTQVRSTIDPDPERFGLVLVHVLHPGFDWDWLARSPVLLDTTYRLSALPHRAVV